MDREKFMPDQGKENPSSSSIEKHLPGYEEHENKFTIEDAINKIDHDLDVAEKTFFDKLERHPNLFEENDYVELGKILDLDTITKESMDLYRKNEAPLPISPSQYCFRIMRRFLERQGCFLGEKQKIFFDAFLGRTEWGSNPKREKDFRLNAINEAKQISPSFPIDDLKNLLEGLELIGKTCFLNQTYEKDNVAFAIGKRIGNSMVNPAGYTRRYLNGISTYDDLIKQINSIEYMFEKNLNFVQFK